MSIDCLGSISLVDPVLNRLTGDLWWVATTVAKIFAGFAAVLGLYGVCSQKPLDDLKVDGFVSVLRSIAWTLICIAVLFGVGKGTKDIFFCSLGNLQNYTPKPIGLASLKIKLYNFTDKKLLFS